MSHEENKLRLFWFLLVCKVLSTIVYVVFLIVLIKYRKELSSGFFRICFALGISDLLFAFISSFHELMLKHKSLFYFMKEWEWWPYFRFSLHNGSYFAQLIGVSLMAVNRFSAILLPRKHEKIWTPTVTSVAIALQLSPLVSFTLLQNFLPVIRVAWHNNSFGMGRVDPKGSLLVFSTACTVELFTAVSTLLLYLIMAVSLYVRWRRAARARHFVTNQPRPTNNRKGTQQRLLMVGVVLSLCIAYSSLWSVIGLMGVYGKGEWISTLPAINKKFMESFATPIVEFVFTFSNPYLMIAMSRTVRTCCFKLIGLDRCWLVTTTLATPSTAVNGVGGRRRLSENSNKAYSVADLEDSTSVGGGGARRSSAVKRSDSNNHLRVGGGGGIRCAIAVEEVMTESIMTESQLDDIQVAFVDQRKF